MNIKTAFTTATFLFILSVSVLCHLKVHIAPNKGWEIGWEIIILAIGLILSLIIGGLNMIKFFKSIDAMREANEIAKEANKKERITRRT